MTAIPRNIVGVLCFVLVICFQCAHSGNIPEYIHICHRSDRRVSRCIQNSVEALRPKLIKGIPELGVPGLDPFHIDKIVIFDGAQNQDLKAHLENIEVMGAGKFELTKVKLDIEKMTYRAGVKIPFLKLQGEYNVDVKLLQTPIIGTGPFHANTTGIEGHAIIQAYLENNKLKFKSFDCRILLHDFNIKLENLFSGGNKILSQAANELLNTNKEDLIRMATPFVEKKCSEIFLKLSNQITQNLDYDEIFPL